MKTPNKRELQQVAFNYSSDIDFKEFMNLNKKCTTKQYFLMFWKERRVIEQAKFTRSPLGKALEKQTKTIDDQEKKQLDKYNSCFFGVS